jgi:hypothetical protein
MIETNNSDLTMRIYDDLTAEVDILHAQRIDVN